MSGNELSVEVKKAIVEKNLETVRQLEYDISINLQVNKTAGDQPEVDRLKAMLALTLKRKEAFEKMLTEFVGKEG
jgi:hypothetical protein